MRQPLIYVRAMRRAAELKGGESALANHLGVPVDAVRWWHAGRLRVPTTVFLEVADILFDHSMSQIDRGDKTP